MNQTLKITERIQNALNILQRIPGLQGYEQWNPICDTMRILAGISQDIQKYEKDQEEEHQEAPGETAEETE